MEFTDAIILKITPYNDTQKIISAFGAETGYISFIASSGGRKGREMSQIMQIAEIEYIKNTKGGLNKIVSISSKIVTTNIYYSVFKMNIALLWGEILVILLKKEEKNERMYDFIEKSVEYLNYSENDFSNFNLFFLFKLNTLLGFEIDTSTYKDGYLFDINGGVFVEKRPLKETYIAGVNTAAIIYKLCTVRLQELVDIPLSGKSRSKLLDIVLLYYSLHLNTDFNTKGIKVLREIFN